MAGAVEIIRTIVRGDPGPLEATVNHSYAVLGPDGATVKTLPWDDALWQAIRETREERPDLATLERLGQHLYPLLGDVYEQAMNSDATADVRIGLRLDSSGPADELFSLPFELLRSSDTGRRLGATDHVLVCYQDAKPPRLRPDPQPDRPVGRLLFGWYGSDLQEVRDQQIRAIQQAFLDGGAQFVQSKDIFELSFQNLKAKLQEKPDERGPACALHILCHTGPLGASEPGYGMVWADGVHPGARVAELLAGHADRLRLVVISSCLGSASAPSGLFRSVALELHKAGVEGVIGARSPITPESSVLLTLELYRSLLCGPSSLEQAFLTARRAIQSAWPGGLDHLALQLFTHDFERWDTRPFTHRPYRGLERFRERDARFFFGRDKEIAETVADLEALVATGRPRLLIVAGGSGTGKSSLVQAGVLPALRRKGWAVAEVLRPSELDAERWMDQVASCTRAPRGEAGLVLVVDQLEEIFTTLDEATRCALARHLWSVAGDPSSGIAVITTLRVEFVGRCGEIVIDQDRRLDHVAYDEAHRVFIERIGPAELRRAIEEPARLVGLVLEDGLAERAAEDVEAEAGALPLVQHAMDRLWRDRTSREIMWPVGGVRGALNKHASAVHDALSEPERASMKQIMVRLVAVRGERSSPLTKLRRTRDQLVGPRPEAELERVLDLLITERLLVSEGSKDAEGGGWIELAHEALITHWDTLRDWLEAARDRMAATSAIEDWARDREHFPLLNAQQLGYAHEVDGKYPGELSEQARELIGRSEVEARRLARAERQQVRRLLIAAALVLVALGALVSIATIASIRAEKEATRSRDRSLMLAAEQAGELPLLAAVLLREVASPSKMNGWMERAAALSWTPLPEKVVGGFDGGVMLASFTPDGKRVLTLAPGGVTLWPVEGQGPGERLEGALETADWAVFSEDGRGLLLRESIGGGVQLWRYDGKGTYHYKMIWQRDGAISANFAPDGSRVVVLMVDRSAQVLDAQRDALVATLKDETSPIEQVQFSGSDARVVTYSRDGQLRLWDMRASAGPEVICKDAIVLAAKQAQTDNVSLGGQGVPPTAAPMRNNGPFLSPRGGLVVAHVGGEPGEWKIWNMLSESCKSVSLTADNLLSNPPAFADDDRSVVFISQQSGLWFWTVGAGLRKVFDAPTRPWYESLPTISSDSHALLIVNTDRRLSRWGLDPQEAPTDLGTVCNAPILVKSILERTEASALDHQLQRWCTDALTAVDDPYWQISVDGERALTRSFAGTAALWRPGRDSLPAPLADLGGGEAVRPTASYSADQEDVVAIRRECKRPPLDSGGAMQPCQGSYSALRIGRTSLVAHEAALKGEWWLFPTKVEQGGFYGGGSDDSLMISAPDQWEGARTIPSELVPDLHPPFDHIFSVTGGRFLTRKGGDLVIAPIAQPDLGVVLGRCPDLYFAALSRDGRHAVAGCSHDDVQTWVIDEAGSAGPTVTIPVEEAPRGGELSSTGKWLAIFGDRQSWVVRSDGTGTLRAIGVADEVLFSSDDRYALSWPTVRVDRPGVLRLWRLDGADEPQEIPVRATDVRAVAFSQDSTRVRLLLDDATVHEFSVDDPSAPPTIYAGPPAYRGSVQELGPMFSADLNHILTTSSAGFVREWPVRDHEQVMEALWRATPYCLPPEERRSRLQENQEEASARFAACQTRVKACQDPSVKECSTVGPR